MITNIKVTFDGKLIPLPDTGSPPSTCRIPITGITGFFGPCGCGKTRVLKAIACAASNYPDTWTKDYPGAKETWNRAQLGFDENSVIELHADKKYSGSRWSPEEHNALALFFIKNPAGLFDKLCHIGGNEEVSLPRMEYWRRADKDKFKIKGPVQKLLNEVLKKNREHETVDPQDTETAFRCPGSLKPFALIREFLSKEILRPGDTLVLDDAGEFMHPTMSVLYAKLMVLLYKQYGIQIIYSSVDESFTQAMSRYCVYYGIYRHVTSYIMHRYENGFGISEVLKDGAVHSVFRDLNRQFDLLSNDSGEENYSRKKPEKWDWAIKS